MSEGRPREQERPAKNAKRPNGTAIIEQCLARGDWVRYARTAALPALEVPVRLQEISREQLGVLEQAALALVADGARSLPVVSSLLGIADRRLADYMRDFAQRGLLWLETDGSFSLTKNGRMSLERGSAVVESTHAVLLSGLTGELLPASAYAAPRFTAGELSRAHCYVLPEQANIALADLDLSRFPDRRAYNLPEEARQILGIDGTPRPCFVECFLLVFQSASSQALGAEIWFADAKLKTAPLELIQPYLEPFGLENPRGSRGALEALARAFTEAGATVEDARLDHFGNPMMRMSRVSQQVLTWQSLGRSVAYFIGTSAQRSRPVAQLRRGGEWDRDVQGHSLVIESTDSAVQETVELCRRLHLLLDECYRTNPASRAREQFRELLPGICSLERALGLAERLEDRRLLGQMVQRK